MRVVGRNGCIRDPTPPHHGECSVPPPHLWRAGRAGLGRAYEDPERGNEKKEQKYHFYVIYILCQIIYDNLPLLYCTSVECCSLPSCDFARLVPM
uniref:Macaca fascicularis brain cDNA clone: QflA-16512, similar to human tensin-like SH2 domain containing 1 (TENS1), mRNA, RefSeq: NM_022748.6 n=1 Tax=Macaca fascicularis TaxID=9541 RepID=I7GL07_MACFA|nr:unnamed protein product [Macaca fascicularis]